MLIELAGKRASVVSIAKDQSIAWGVAPHRNGGRLAITYLNDKAEHYVRPLAEIVGAEITLPLDVTRVGQEKPLFTRIAGLWGGHDMVVRSIAFAPGDDLHGSILDSDPLTGPAQYRRQRAVSGTDGHPGSGRHRPSQRLDAESSAALAIAAADRTDERDFAAVQRLSKPGTEIHEIWMRPLVQSWTTREIGHPLRMSHPTCFARWCGRYP